MDDYLNEFIDGELIKKWFEFSLFLKFGRKFLEDALF